MEVMPILKPRTIFVFGGGQFSFDDPDNSQYNIESIAHALSHICRFTGHTSKFYSVAEHCFHVSYLVPEELAFQGLMHDAHEAFVGDVSSPLKQMIPDYKKIEDRVERSMRRRFDLPEKFDPRVKEADISIYRTEASFLTSDNDRFWHLQADPADATLHCWSPSVAQRMFLKRFKELYGKGSSKLSGKAAPSTKAA